MRGGPFETKFFVADHKESNPRRVKVSLVQCSRGVQVYLNETPVLYFADDSAVIYREYLTSNQVFEISGFLKTDKSGRVVVAE